MANPEAIMRAAQTQPMGAPPADMPGDDAGAPPGGGGLDNLVESLRGVGEFLKAQGPAGQVALGHFQALLQAMSQMSGGAQPPQEAPPAPEAKGNGRIHESQVPGVQVL